jgi:hypothetical protein
VTGLEVILAVVLWGAVAGFVGDGLGRLCDRIGYRPGRAVRFLALLACGPVGWFAALWVFTEGE